MFGVLGLTGLLLEVWLRVVKPERASGPLEIYSNLILQEAFKPRVSRTPLIRISGMEFFHGKRLTNPLSPGGQRRKMSQGDRLDQYVASRGRLHRPGQHWNLKGVSRALIQ